jgi:hypothetical protein
VRPDDLEGPERLLCQAFPRGERVDLGTGEIRAEVIAALLLGAVEPEPGHFAGIRIRGGRITGRLDLDGMAFGAVLECDGCEFTDEVALVETTARTVRFRNSRMPLLNAARLRLEGLFDLTGSTVGTLRLGYARLDSKVRLRRTTLGTDLERIAVAAEGIVVSGRLDCSQMRVTGPFDIRDGQIGALFNLQGATIAGRSRRGAFIADNLQVRGRFDARDATVDGGLRIQNAHVASLHLGGARLTRTDNAALHAGGLTVDGGVWCWEGFSAEGELRLIGARLGANLNLDDARLANPGGVALNLDSATAGEVTAQHLVVESGQVSMVGTQIAGALDLPEARLAEGMHVENATLGSVRLRNLYADGEVTLRISRVAGRIFLHGAEIIAPGNVALRLSRTQVGADIYAKDMRLRGALLLRHARIDSNLDLTGSRIEAPDGLAVDAQNLVAGVMTLLPAEPFGGAVTLSHARIGVLRDDPERWPARLRLDGLTYEALEPALPPAVRLDWLRRDPEGFQPYEQLAAHYTAVGRHADARVVLHAKERRQRGSETVFGRVWGGLQDYTTGYGYQPWRAVLWLAVLLTAGTALYGHSPPRALKPGEAPHFNPFGYTLDLLLPIVDLGQERAFNPAGAHQWLSYLLIAAGWVLATTIAAGAARVVGRR